MHMCMLLYVFPSSDFWHADERVAVPTIGGSEKTSPLIRRNCRDAHGVTLVVYPRYHPPLGHKSEPGLIITRGGILCGLQYGMHVRMFVARAWCPYIHTIG